MGTAVKAGLICCPSVQKKRKIDGGRLANCNLEG